MAARSVTEGSEGAPSDRRRVSGPRVLVALSALVTLTVALTVTCARLTPGVPDARERRRGFALPGADPDAPPPMGAVGAPPRR